MPYQLTKIQVHSSNIADNFKMSKFSKGHSSEKIDGIRSQVNLVIHVSSSISWPSFKLLGQILCEIFCWQEFILVFSKEHNSRKGDNSDKKTNTGQPFFIKNPYMKFRNPSMHCSLDMAYIKNCDERIHGRTGGCTHNPKPICPPLLLQSKKISSDQELIQSDPTSCPQNQKGNN